MPAKVCEITKLPTAFTFCPKFLPNCKVTPLQKKKKKRGQDDKKKDRVCPEQKAYHT